MHPGISARTAIRCGLALIAVSTLAMGADHHFAAWLILRGVAGIASALVMIAVSAWILPRLAQCGARKSERHGLRRCRRRHRVCGRERVWCCCDWTRPRTRRGLLLGATAAIVTVAVWRVVGDGRSPPAPRVPADGFA